MNLFSPLGVIRSIQKLFGSINMQSISYSRFHLRVSLHSRSFGPYGLRAAGAPSLRAADLRPIAAVLFVSVLYAYLRATTQPLCNSKFRHHPARHRGTSSAGGACRA